jgi:hypothetical protein
MFNINSDEDLKNISDMVRNNKPFHKLKSIYKLPAYRCIICIGEFDYDLFISFEHFSLSRCIRDFQLRWFHDIYTFIKISNRFGFVREFIPHGQTGTLIERPNDFEIVDENLLISELLNTNHKNYLMAKFSLK